MHPQMSEIKKKDVLIRVRRHREDFDLQAQAVMMIALTE